ncbi:hypothetical protein BDQ17DRAFT_1423815 [Cyathus striatus]|nr:hypothetical protein BDQ17DRAFT_1423815 [Cyathus striatus]
MSTVEDFEALLKDVIQAKRLSASKMQKLTETALKIMDKDTQVVSILYRTHMGTSGPAKLHSLYVFDALARAARHQVNKHGFIADSKSQTGNCASFLLKAEGVVEGVLRDTVLSGNSESKVSGISALLIFSIFPTTMFPQPRLLMSPFPIYSDKLSRGLLVIKDPAHVDRFLVYLLPGTAFKFSAVVQFPNRVYVQIQEKAKKILDIWAKGNTFTSTVLSRLSSVLKETEKVSEVEVNSAITPSDPRVSVASSSVTSAQPTADAQAALLALLTQAASTGNLAAAPLQTSVNTAVQPVSLLDPTQLAVLQQLAQTVKGNADVPHVPQAATVVYSNNVPTAPSSSQLPALRRDESHVMITKDPRSDRYRSPEQAYSIDSHHNFHTYPRGGIRGGLRVRGRGDRRRWDGGDRDRDHYRERERSPPYRDRRSRSRSPTHRHSGGRRDSGGYSPRRPVGVLSSRQPRDDITTLEAGKDEFGRDLRPESPDNLLPPITPNGSDSVESPTFVDKSTLDSSPALTSSHTQRSMSPSVAANTSSNNPSEHSISSTELLQPGLEQFDLATFDFTSSSSWETLGKMWQVTNGYLPSTEQLMQFVISCQAATAPQAGWNSWGATSPSGQAWGSKGERGGFARDEGFANGNGRNGTEKPWNQDTHYPTDAVVLGEPDTSLVCTSEDVQQSDNRSSGVGGGRMQRIGDKWVFVRDALTNVS